jgi:hypothetical protein
MIEYIKNNNIENGDEILHAYKTAYLDYKNYKNTFGWAASIGEAVIKSEKVFRSCLIHDTRLSTLFYYGREEAENSWFEGLKILAKSGHEHLVSIGGNKYYPCNDPCRSFLESNSRWNYCTICVSESQLIKDVKEDNWTMYIVTKYGFEWVLHSPFRL